MDKIELLAHLKGQVYARLGSSKLHGIGVVAIREIPEGIDPFSGIRPVIWIEVSESELNGVDEAVTSYMKDMCVFKDGKYLVPDYGFNGLDISWYLNHSNTPNLRVEEGYLFMTTRSVRAGEELTVDYSSYCDGQEIFR